MGCIVNGPGEMADADYGYVGKAGGKISLYRARDEVKSGISQENGVQELIALIKSDGKWFEPPIDYVAEAAPTAFNDRITVGIPLKVK